MQNFILFKINNWSERDFFISITLVKNTAFASRWDRKFLPRSNYVFPVCSLKKPEGNRILRWRTKRRRNSPSKSIEETYAKRSWLLLQSPVYFLISLDFPVKWYIHDTRHRFSRNTFRWFTSSLKRWKYSGQTARDRMCLVRPSLDFTRSSISKSTFRAFHRLQ